MEGLRQGGQDMEKVHWAQDEYSRQELCVARLGSQLPRQWRRVDQYVRRNFHHRSLACNNIYYPVYMQSLASLPAPTPISAILYTCNKMQTWLPSGKRPPEREFHLCERPKWPAQLRNALKCLVRLAREGFRLACS